MDNNVEKIAILGGGVSGITAAFKLTSEQDWQSKYDITLYQMGWRNGGKGASGRNIKEDNRIEEHGIHVWFGFYYQAFKAMRACYKELDRPADAPCATIEEAFVPHHNTAFAQEFNNQWTIWPIITPPLPGKPGEGINSVTILQALADVVAWLLTHTGKSDIAMFTSDHKSKSTLFDSIEQSVRGFFQKIGLVGDAFAPIEALHKTLSEFDESSNEHPVLIEIIHLAREAIRKVTAPFVDKHIEVARIWMLADMVLTSILGIIVDQLYDMSKGGLDAANNENYRDWLIKHGVSDMTVNGAVLSTLYGGIFAYKDGDLNQPNVETGTILRAGMTAVTCGKESFVFRMQAGMGDVVFAPYYEVLSKRGVKFKFFHEVSEVVAQGAEVTCIKMNQQVPLKDPSKEYNPLFDVKGLPCWPIEPLYDQIQDDVAKLLIDNNINLESTWSNWSEIYQQPEIVLEQGKDFDTVILNISVAGLNQLCPTLCALNPKFDAMTKGISTVCTQAVQTWGTQTVREMGSTLFEKSGETPECLGFATQAMDSWADVSYLVKTETWPEATAPKNIAYFCGVFAPTQVKPKPDPAYPIEQALVVKNDFIKLLEERITLFWPNANEPDGKFNWDLLVAPQGVTSQARFDSQYWRANLDPSERYVQSIVGTSKYRLKTDESGFNNLYLTGDWIQNGFNMGSVESATIAGLLTAVAVSGSGEKIQGTLQF